MKTHLNIKNNDDLFNNIKLKSNQSNWITHISGISLFASLMLSWLNMKQKSEEKKSAKSI